jgi:glutamate formiminotransferase / formiminotetrahydrofolate cyclodeaminase
MPKLVECVPNVSEGRHRDTIDAIARAIRGVAGVKLLDVDAGADTNRTVYTFVGEPAAVCEAAVRVAHAAFAHIDMAKHQGAHPRIGALDVCPFVPVSEVTMEECAALAGDAGRQIADELNVPVYFYEHAASTPERRSLATIRAGEYEGLPQKLQDPRWRPDCGPARFEPRYGATVVGAREFLLAYNVNLNTRDRRLAHDIALTIREGGRNARDAQGRVVHGPDGEPVKRPGRLQAVRAIGWYIEEYRQAQVSINLLDYKTTPLHVVFETVSEEAARLGLRVTGSELVGLTPLAPLVDAGRYYLRRHGRSSGVSERELIETAVQSLGLGQLAPFDPSQKVIEMHFREPAPLASMVVGRFLEEVASDSPAPGGGSVAALAGALGASLVAMVTNLTIGKTGFEAAADELNTAAEHAQRLMARLAWLVDEDTRAFARVMEARRLPKATSEQEQSRAAAIAEASKYAAEVPLQTMRACREVLALSQLVAEKGNPNSASDAGVSALMAHAGLESAALNVLINLPGIDDRTFVEKTRDEVDRLRREAREMVKAPRRSGDSGLRSRE